MHDSTHSTLIIARGEGGYAHTGMRLVPDNNATHAKYKGNSYQVNTFDRTCTGRSTSDSDNGV